MMTQNLFYECSAVTVLNVIYFFKKEKINNGTLIWLTAVPDRLLTEWATGYF